MTSRLDGLKSIAAALEKQPGWEGYQVSPFCVLRYSRRLAKHDPLQLDGADHPKARRSVTVDVLEAWAARNRPHAGVVRVARQRRGRGARLAAMRVARGQLTLAW